MSLRTLLLQEYVEGTGSHEGRLHHRIRPKKSESNFQLRSRDLISLNSPLTSDLSAFIFENAQLISSGINIMNISEKKGSFLDGVPVSLES